MAPLRRDSTGRQVHDAFADPRPDKVSSLSSIGGAPVGSTYVTISNDGTLTAERALAVTAGELTLADGGANTSVTLGLANVLVAGGPTGNATTVPIITWDAKGRLTAVSSAAITGVPPGGAAGGDLSGTYPNPSVVDDSHNHTSTTLPATIVYDGDAAGGDLTGTYPNPTIADADLIAIRDLAATAGLLSRSGAGAFVARTLTAPAAGITVSNGTGAGGNPTLALANDLAALEGLSGTGLVARTASETFVERSLTAPAAGITISNPAGIAGNPTFALANDLAALEGMAGTGLVVRTAAETYAQRTIAVTDSSSVDFTITNADGVSGNPTITATVIASGVDHGGLGGLTDDDHARYLDINGRTGTTNNPTLSTSTDGTLTGSSNSGSALVLKATSSGTGLINATDELRVRTGLSAVVNSADTFMVRAAVSATSDGNTGGFLKIFGITGTLTQNTAPGIISQKGYHNGLVYVHTAGTGFVNLSSGVHGVETRADGIAVTSGTTLAWVDEQAYAIANGGSIGGTTSHTSYWSAPSVGASATMPTRYGLRVSDVTGAGSVTTQIGVELESFTKATTNISLRSSGTATLRHAGGVRIGDTGTAPTDKLEVVGNIAMTGSGTLYGSTAASGTLTLASTRDTTKSLINAQDELRFRTGLTSITTGFGGGTATSYYFARAHLALNATDALNTISVIAATGTFDDQSANLVYLFNNSATLSRSTSGSSLSTVTALFNAPTLQSNGRAITAGTSIGFSHGPTYAVTAGGTIAGVVDDALRAGMAVGASVTITTRTGMNFQDATGAGDVTNQIAVDVAALTDHVSGAGTSTNVALRSAIAAATNNYFLRDTGGAQSSLVGKFTTYNNVATVQGGLAALYAEINATAQGADIGSATLYAVPAAGAGLYRISAWIQVTRAATSSSTMPAVRIGWTDQDASVAFTNQSMTATNTGNTTSIYDQAVWVINAKASTNITYNTNGWASSGATSMQYAVRLRVEAI